MRRDRADSAAAPDAGTQVCGPVRWRRSRRARQVSLRIDVRAGEVVVTLPPRATRQAGLALLAEHAAWVRGSLAALAPPTPLVLGAVVPVRDMPHEIRLAQPDAAGAARLSVGVIHVPDGPAETVPPRVAALLQAEARNALEAAAARHAAALDVQVKAVRLKDPRSRWGSCAPDGTLAFSWRLVMAPDWVLDHVVAHEVAHLRELNHSERFWAQLAHLSPHQEETTAWLKAHGPRLLRVG